MLTDDIQAPAPSKKPDWLTCEHRRDRRDDWDRLEAEAGAQFKSAEARDRYRKRESIREPELKGHIQYQPEGRTVIISRTDATPNESGNPGGGIRGAITSFSRKSRRRLLNLVHQLEKDADCQFVTLTYHETNPDPHQAKAHLRAFFHRLRRMLDGVRWSMVWRMEWQKRGTIHFHLLIFGLKWMPWDRCKRMWHDVTGEDSGYHRRIGCWIKKLTTAKMVSNYCAKYVGKESSEAEAELLENEAAGAGGSVGRIWGVRRKKYLPRASFAAIEVPWAVATEIIAGWMLEMTDGQCEYVPASVTVYAEDPEEYLKNLGFDP